MAILPIAKNILPNNPPEKINGKWMYPYFRILGANIDLEGTAEGRYGGYFGSVSGSKANYLFHFDAMIPTVTADGSKHYVYGKSVLGTLSSQLAKSTFDAAVAMATVNASGQIKSNSFKATARGVDEAKWNKLRSLGGVLDAGRIKELGQALGESLEWCIEEAKVGTYLPSGVAEITEEDWNYAESVIFALNRIKKRNTFADAKEELNKRISSAMSRKKHLGIDLLTVAAVYHRLNTFDGRPDENQATLARKILNNFDLLPPANNEVKPYYFEVAPFHYEDGTVPSLLRLSRENRSRIAVRKWPISKADLGGPVGDIESETLDFNAALRVGAAGLVDMNASADMTIKRYGFTALRPANGLANTMIIREIYAAGFKVRVKISEADSRLDVAAISAKSTLNATQAEYEIEGLGFNLSELTSLPNFLASAVGKFDVNTFNSLGILYEEVSDLLDHLMTDDNIQPMLVAVDLNLGAPEVQGLVQKSGDKLKSLISKASELLGEDADFSEESASLDDVKLLTLGA